MTKRIKKGLQRMRNMYRIHGIFPVLSFYISKIYPLKWLFKRLSLRWLIPVKIQGSLMYLDAHDPGISTTLLTNGVREIGHVDQIRSNISPGMTGIDLGSNIGYYALIEAQLIGKGGTVYSIEPEPGNLELLKKNIKANGVEDRFFVSQYIVGDRDELSKLHLSALSNRHSLSTSNRYGVSTGDKMPFIEVPMIKLDTFMEQNKLQPQDIDFLRMDIEGYEVVAFQGMNRLLSARTPLKIFMEFHPAWYGEWGWTYEKLLDYLESFGFRVKGLAYERKETVFSIKDPSREEILKARISAGGPTGGAQAFLERT